jgi:hypothetical protein
MDICNYFGKDNIALVAVSLGNENAKVAYEIAVHSKLPLKDHLGKVHIISFEKEYLIDRATQDGFFKDVIIHDYEPESISSLKDCYKNIIIIDDLSHAMEFIPKFLKKMLDLYPYNFIIVLANMKTSREDIKKFSDYYDDCHFWNDNFMNNKENKLTLKLYKSPITHLQDIKIKKLMEKCKKKPGLDEWKLDNHRNCKRFCNIVYPYEVQIEIEEASRNSEEDEYFKANSPYKMIMRLGGKKEFLQLSPKFKNLLGVLDNTKGRHIIYTSFDSYYGSDILYELLKGEYSTLVINPELVESEKEKIINKWNKNKSYEVLIITTSVPVVPKNVSHIHIMDGNMKEIYERIFEISDEGDLTVHFHSSEKMKPEDEKIIDEYTFPVFYEYLLEKKNFWYLVLEKSKDTKLNKSNRIEV